MIPIHMLRPLERFRAGLNVVLQDGEQEASVQVVWCQPGQAPTGVIVLATQREEGVDVTVEDYAEVLR